jgi:hypothetical protein
MYQVNNPRTQAMSGMQSAGATYGKMDKDIPANRPPGPTVGGAAASGAAGAQMGGKAGGMVGTYMSEQATAALIAEEAAAVEAAKLAAAQSGTAVAAEVAAAEVTGTIATEAAIAETAAAGSAAGPWGLAIGAGIGIGAYLLS